MNDLSFNTSNMNNNTNISENEHFDKFQDFLKEVQGSLNDQSDKNFLCIVENLKTPIFRIKNPQDLEEITKLYHNTFPSTALSPLIKTKPKKKWTHQEIALLAWLVSHCSILIGKDFDHFSENDWHFLAGLVRGWDINKIRFKWFSIQKSIEQKTSWTNEEDQKLAEIINRRQISKKSPAIYKWTEIAEELNKSKSSANSTRLGKHCRERWFNHLDPTFKKGEWTQDEDYELIKLITRYGKKWSMISRLIGSRNENSVKNRFFALKRKYSKIYKQMPQSDKKMVIFLAQKLKPGTHSTNDLDVESKLTKKLKKNPNTNPKKRFLTVETKNTAALYSENGCDSSKKSDIFHSTLNTRNSLNPSSTQLTSLNTSDNVLKSTSEINKASPYENHIQHQNKPSLEDILSKNSLVKRTGVRSQTHTPLTPYDTIHTNNFNQLNDVNEKEEQDKVETKKYKPTLHQVRTHLMSADLSHQFSRNMNFYEIPNMYTQKPTDEHKKTVLLYPNKEILNILNLPFDIIDEEDFKKEDPSKDLSQIFSSMSLSDQYIVESNKILSGIRFNPTINNSLSSSSKIITESFNRSISKHNTCTVTSGKSSSRILENISPVLKSLVTPKHSHNNFSNHWGSSLNNFNSHFTNFSNSFNLNHNKNVSLVPSCESFITNNNLNRQTFEFLNLGDRDYNLLMNDPIMGDENVFHDHVILEKERAGFTNYQMIYEREAALYEREAAIQNEGIMNDQIVSDRELLNHDKFNNVNDAEKNGTSQVFSMLDFFDLGKN